MHKPFAALVCCALLVQPGAAQEQATQQPSIVPAAHGVYDWLWSQRVWGRLPTYDHEVRPASRGVILGHLRALARDSATYSATDRALLRDFLNEFDFDRLLANGLLKTISLRDPFRTSAAGLRTRKDPYLWAGRSADSTLSGAVWMSGGAGNAYERVIGDRSHYVTFRSRVLRTFADFRSGFGLSAEFDGANATGGDVPLLGLDPRFNGDWQHRLANDALGAWHHEAWASFAARHLRVDFGSGDASYGPATTDALVLRADGPDITQLRVQAGVTKLQFLFAVGAMLPPHLVGSDSARATDGSILIIPNRAQRWETMHRLTWRPSPRITLSAHEMMVYGGSPDPRLMIPVYPVSLLTNDADAENVGNGLIGADVTARPRGGTELFASVLVDHINIGGIGELIGLGKRNHTKKAVSIGLQQRLPGELRLGVGYLRVDPFVYSHWTRLAAWEVDGLPLGAAAGPNSDEWSARLTRWLPFRTRAMVGLRRVRQGLNPIDATGATTQDVGGDIKTNANAVGPFLRGADVQAYHRFEFELESEPLRGVKVTLRKSAVDVYQGTRIPSRRGTTFFRVSVGY